MGFLSSDFYFFSHFSLLLFLLNISYLSYLFYFVTHFLSCFLKISFHCCSYFEVTMSNGLATIFANEECHIGDYLLLNTIGKGCFAEVWLAWHMLTETEVVVKAISHRGFSVFFQEVHCFKGLNHLNITKLFEVSATQNKLYLFLEHVSGGDLFDYLENYGHMTRRMPEPCSSR